MKVPALVGLFLLLSTLAHAQTTGTATWLMVEDLPTAQQFKYTLNNGSTPIAMGPATCATVNAKTQCSASITGALSAGSYTLTASNGFATATSDPFVAAAPGKPTIITITVTIAVQPQP
jgi:hypothetical protein